MPLTLTPYGSMLWDLYANKVFRTWNTCVKLSWKIPRWTHNYFVEHLLTPKLSSIRKWTLCQYLGFFRKLLQSSNPEIQLLDNTVGRDSGSVTAANLRNIEHEFGKDPWVTTATGLSSVYKLYVIPDVDKWRLPLLMKLLDQRRVQFACDEDTSHLNEVIDSLCCSWSYSSHFSFS